jgi:hypothetical protein
MVNFRQRWQGHLGQKVRENSTELTGERRLQARWLQKPSDEGGSGRKSLAPGERILAIGY